MNVLKENIDTVMLYFYNHLKIDLTNAQRDLTVPCVFVSTLITETKPEEKDDICAAIVYAIDCGLLEAKKEYNTSTGASKYELIRGITKDGYTYLKSIK